MQIEIIGVPLDLGAGRRGVDMGPSAIRYAGLRQGLEVLDHVVTDHGNLTVPGAETCDMGNPWLKYLEPVTDVLQHLAARVAQSIAAGRQPLVLGGDHSVSLGSVIGAAQTRKLGLIWIDAHTGFHTQETSPSGSIHGMPLSALLGYGAPPLVSLNGRQSVGARLEPHNVALIGVRSIDPQEKRLLRASGVTVYSMEAIDQFGMNEVMERASEISCRGTDAVYLSLDLDSVDPLYAPGVGTPVPGGLTFREAHLAIEVLANTKRLIGLDVVEVNPVLDRVNMTADLTVKLALAACGQRIWDA